MRTAMLAALALLSAAGPARAQDIALTFDDLPSHSALPPGETRLGVVARLVAALADAGAPPSMGFVNAASLQDEPDLEAVLEVWRAAGHPVGNHGWSHANLDTVGAEAFTEEITRNEPMLQALADDTDWRWFRFPFLAEGRDPDVRRKTRETLKSRGYRIASVTMDFSDWAFNEPYARCRAEGDAAGVARLEALYMAAAEEALVASRRLSHDLHGRDVPYVLLMHAGAMDAHMLPRLLAFYRDRGARLVTLDQAMADPFYDADREVRATLAPLTLETAAAAAGLSSPPRVDRQAELAALCR